MKKNIEIYVDGACSGNPGAGGWAAFLRCGDIEKEISGYDLQTTNNRMELTAAIEGLKALKTSSHRIDIYTDSKYLKDGVNLWLAGWKQKGWVNSKKEPVKNQDLWLALDELIKERNIQWYWVKGHSGHEENERVDTLAKIALQRGVLLNSS